MGGRLGLALRRQRQDLGSIGRKVPGGDELAGGWGAGAGRKKQNGSQRRDAGRIRGGGETRRTAFLSHLGLLGALRAGV